MKNRKRKKEWRKCRRGRGILAFLLVLLLSFSPCSLWLEGSIRAEAATFTITKLKKESIIQDGYFYFYGSLLLPELFYWIKNDGSPLFCIQKKAHIVTDLYGGEVVEEYDESRYLSEEQYELISLVLQCCGMIQGEDPVLEPGTYLAGQAAVWGITSLNWRDSQYFRQEMETVHAHIEDWYDTPAEEILAQSQEAVDRICEAIDAYYGDESPYIPAFASKYEKKAPVWTVSKKEDGSCEAVFMLEDKSEAIKEFVFTLPEGWNYEWQEDRVIFRCEQAQEGVVSIKGEAKPGTELDEAMPIGLVHIVGPANFPHFQRLASEVECKAKWSCYFKLSVSAPEDKGSWRLPQVNHYRHQETFTALYGAGIEKVDGETMEPIAGVEFQPLVYFDECQLENTCLDKRQIETWKGWKEDCSPEITDQEGHLEHWDKREYFYEKTYCSGHPEPEITYEGSDESRREELREEAERAWEEEVEECSRACDFHSIDGSGEMLLEEDRDLAYQQFIHLVYGYSFRETKPAPGYLPPGKHKDDEEIGRVFLTSVQAGGDWQEEDQDGQQKEQEEGQQEERQEEQQGEQQEVNLSQHRVETVSASQGETASDSNAEHEVYRDEHREEEENRDKGREDGKDSTEKNVEVGVEGDEEAGVEKDKEDSAEKDEETGVKIDKEDGAEEDREDSEEGDKEAGIEKEGAEENKETGIEKDDAEEKGKEEREEEKFERKKGEKRAKRALRQAREDFVWLTSLVAPLVQAVPDKEVSCLFTVKNYKEVPPPEETIPEETPPEETPPEETTPEETLPEETTPEETSPEETMPEETPPETVPEATVPEETLPPSSGSPGSSGGGGHRRVEILPPGKTSETPPETSEFFMLPEEPIPQAFSRMGWIEAEYATPSIIQKRKDSPGTGDFSGALPRTGDRGVGDLVFLLICSGGGGILLFRARKRRKAAALFLGVLLCIPWGKESRAELQEGKNPPPIQDEEMAEGRIVRYFSAEEMLEDDEKAVITDEDGQQYWLESCRLVSRILPEREEWVSEKVVYSAVESDKQIPERLWFQSKEEDTDRTGEGELLRTFVTASETYWDNGFQIPLRFCDYDAEAYRLQGMEVPKAEALAYLMEHQEGLLTAAGCSPTAYHLDGISWSGESYAVQGVTYRDALAYGKKKVSDCVVEYAGTLVYPEEEQEQWEAIYALPVAADPQPESRETEVMAEEEEIPETAAEAEPAVPQENPNFSWIKLRTIAAYTVSLAVLLPVLGYLILLFSRKKRPFME